MTDQILHMSALGTGKVHKIYKFTFSSFLYTLLFHQLFLKRVSTWPSKHGCSFFSLQTLEKNYQKINKKTQNKQKTSKPPNYIKEREKPPNYFKLLF